jgi:hypothetical protein
MPLNDELSQVIEQIDLLMAEHRSLRAKGPSFRIVHRFRVAGTDCAAGEEVFIIVLVHRGREFPLRLSLAQRILFDYLAHSRFPQSAGQIELGIRANTFYQKHAANVARSDLNRTVSRSGIKTYVRRIREALAIVFNESGMHADPRKVLVAEPTVSNQVGYALRATCDWSHTDCEPR